MSSICPKCRGAFENIDECPKCRVPLSDLGGRKDDALGTFAQSDGFRWGKPGARPEEPATARRTERWHQSPAGRLVAGILLSLGLSYGLLQLTVTILRLAGKGEPGALSPVVGLVIFYGLQAPAVFLAGMLAGVNRRNGFMPGSLVGLMSGVAAVVTVNSGILNALIAPLCSNLFSVAAPANPIMVQKVVAVHQLTVFALPLVYLVFAALGGVIGSKIWSPAPEIATAVLISPADAPPVVGLKTTINMPKQEKERSALIGGKISWVRVLAGAFVAIAGGSIASRPVREFVLNFVPGMFEIKDNQQDSVTLAEIFALALLLGGAVSGAGVANGLKQGLIVGFAAGLGMVPFLAGGEQAAYTPYIVLSAVFLAPLGGWFGTTLLPPPPPPRLAPPPD